MRYPVAPLAARLHIDLGRTDHGPTDALHGLHELAARLNISHRQAQRALMAGLSDNQADRYAIAAGFHPAHIWPDWYARCPDEHEIRRAERRAAARARRAMSHPPAIMAG